MNNFDLRKYLAEGKLLKEDITSKAISVLKNYEGEVEGVEGYIKYLMNTSDDISSSIQAIADDLDRDNDTSDSLRRDLEKLSLDEGKLLKEDKGINYLKKAFQIYLEGGDEFNKEVGETETVKFENDGSLIPEEEFKVALQSLPTTVKVDVYNVNFKKVGDNIVGTFKIK